MTSKHKGYRRTNFGWPMSQVRQLFAALVTNKQINALIGIITLQSLLQIY